MIVTPTTSLSFASSALAGSLAIIVARLLLALLILKELAASVKDSRTWKLNKSLSIAIVPLLIIFGLIAVSKVIEVLR